MSSMYCLLYHLNRYKKEMVAYSAKKAAEEDEDDEEEDEDDDEDSD